MLEQAIRDGDTATARSLLAADPELANGRTEDGLSLILLALFHQQAEIRDALLAAGPRLGVLELAALGEAEPLAAQLERDPQALDFRTPDGFDPLVARRVLRRCRDRRDAARPRRRPGRRQP